MYTLKMLHIFETCFYLENAHKSPVHLNLDLKSLHFVIFFKTEEKNRSGGEEIHTLGKSKV